VSGGIRGPEGLARGVEIHDRLVVANGRIAEAGSHEGLIRQGGLYADLYQLQASGYR
jgi:ATP-binding cassette subfamily B protein